MAELWTYVIEFLSKFGWQAAFGISLLYNISLTVAWIRREKNLELVEISLANFMPNIKFELNKDQKYNTLANENLKLKAENAILKQKRDNLPLAILAILVIVMLVSTIVDKFKKNKEDIPKPSEDTKSLTPEILVRDTDPFDTNIILEKIELIQEKQKINNEITSTKTKT